VRQLLAMPAPDRIALARELLAGTGRVVARNVPLLNSDLFDGASNDAKPFRNGWNACRAAMMEDGECPPHHPGGRCSGSTTASTAATATPTADAACTHADGIATPNVARAVARPA
jgi:hypothetical protein